MPVFDYGSIRKDYDQMEKDKRIPEVHKTRVVYTNIDSFIKNRPFQLLMRCKFMLFNALSGVESEVQKDILDAHGVDPHKSAVYPVPIMLMMKSLIADSKFSFIKVEDTFTVAGYVEQYIDYLYNKQQNMDDHTQMGKMSKDMSVVQISNFRKLQNHLKEQIRVLGNTYPFFREEHPEFYENTGLDKYRRGL